MSRTATKPLFTVLRGNPTDTEIAALTAVLTQIASAKATQERNNWGSRTRDHVFNPNAFHNVTYF